MLNAFCVFPTFSKKDVAAAIIFLLMVTGLVGFVYLVLADKGVATFNCMVLGVVAMLVGMDFTKIGNKDFGDIASLATAVSISMVLVQINTGFSEPLAFVIGLIPTFFILRASKLMKDHDLKIF